MKPYIKELIGFAIASFLIFGLVMLVIEVIFSDITVNWRTVWSLIVGAVVYSALMTLFKYLTDRRRNRG